MTYAWAVALLIGVTAGGIACRDTSRADASELQNIERVREKQLTSRLANADADTSRAGPVAVWLMPNGLREISGLAVTADGRLLTHDDEVGRISVIDPKRGVLLKQFTLGDSPPRADFEAITVAGSDIYLLASNGTLYEFNEGADGSHVPYTIHDTRLGKECEFESVAYEANSDWLLMPCKRVGKKKLQDQLVIYRWRLGSSPSDSAKASMLTIPLSRVIGSNHWKSFHPSDMSIDPVSGNYVMVASHEKALVEITPLGQVVRSVPLPGRHNQAEGVAITKDSILIVSDEATNKPGAITLYRWRP
jgi:uncharacterized protein YjiK